METRWSWPHPGITVVLLMLLQKTGSQPVSEADNRNMVEFWKQIYGIDMGKAVKVSEDVRSYLYLTLIAENYGSVSKREKKRQLL
jgi:hypothetical protein